MTFTEFLNKITHKQVEEWWTFISKNKQIIDKADPGWKYTIVKDGIELPFNWAIRNLAQFNSFINVDFGSNDSTRNRFCDKFGFSVKEELVYLNKEYTMLIEFYSKLKHPELFNQFIEYANSVLLKGKIDPYKIRMGIRAKTAMAIIGMRGVLYYTESSNKVFINLMVSNDFWKANKSRYKFSNVLPFEGIGNKSFVKIEIENWDNLDSNLLENNTQQIIEEYNYVKDKKIAQWNKEANTSNNALKYLMFKNPEIHKFMEIGAMNKNAENVNKQKDKNIAMKPINQILYGPPGTGKTFNTINKALEILDENELLEKGNREDIKAKYDEYVKSGQIVFTTFHQSMSYEDFIEGIKPRTNEFGRVTYEIEDGIFKNIAKIAEESINIKKTTGHSNLILSDEIFANSKFFKVSLGDSQTDNGDEVYEWCINNNRIAIGWGGNINFETAKDEKEIKDLIESNEEPIKSPNDFRLVAMKCLRLSMKPGDIVFVSNGNRKLKAIAQIAGDYEFLEKSDNSFKQTRLVKWLYKDINVPVNEVYSSYFSQASIYQLSKKKIKNNYFKASELKDSLINPYVLIIDEINRGNVSQIFGELITLIEEDKRIGAREELRVKLPYSKVDEEPFGVPSNLYIIGTMNTADRSVEALDTALRRRFVFEAMPPKPELLKPQRQIWSLWWDYLKYEWDEEPYKSAERKLSELLEADLESFDMGAIIWKKMKAEGKREDQIDNFNSIKINGIQLDQLLITINKRIEILLDKDHQIGHAYFINVFSIDDLILVFKDKIIPLLQEYFYGDIGKICLVLGDSFIEKKNDVQKKLFASKQYDPSLISDFESKTTYIFTEPEKWDFKSIYE